MAWRSFFKNSRHPLHPIALAFALGVYALTPLLYILSYFTQSLFLYRTGLIVTGIAIFAALMVTLPGFIDLAGGAPGKPRQQNASVMYVLGHMMLSLVAIIVFCANAFYSLPEWNSPEFPDVGLSVAITLAGFFIKLAAFYFGMRLIRSEVFGVEVPFKAPRGMAYR